MSVAKVERLKQTSRNEDWANRARYYALTETGRVIAKAYSRALRSRVPSR